MLTFKQYLLERNEENHKKSQELKRAGRVYRVDPSDRKDPWKQTRYGVGRWGSATLPDNSPKKVGDDAGGGNTPIETITKPSAFATPDKPNAMYAVPRKGENGKPVPLAHVKHPDEEKGKLFITRRGLEQIPKEVKISSASSKNFTTPYYADSATERVSDKTPQDTKTTIVKNPVGFIKSQNNIEIRPNVKSIIKAIRKEKVSNELDKRAGKSVSSIADQT